MKTKIPAIAAFTLALSLVPLGAQTTLTGDHVVTGDLTVEQTLSVEGNAIDFGTTSSTNAAVAWQYSEVGTNAFVVMTATEPEAGFLWRDNALGTLVPKMQLDGTNALSLFLPDGSAVGIFLDPAGESTFAESVVMGGTNNLMPNQILTGDDSVLTRILADARYLPAGALASSNNATFASARVGDMVLTGQGVDSDFGVFINFEERYWSQGGTNFMRWDSDWVRFPQGAHFGDDDIYVGESGIRGFGGQLSFEERLVCDGFGTTNEWIAFSWDKEEGFSLGTHLAFHGTNAATNRVKSRDNLGLGVTNHVEFGALTISDNEIEQVIITGQGISGWGGRVFWSMEELTFFQNFGATNQSVAFRFDTLGNFEIGSSLNFIGPQAETNRVKSRNNLGLGPLATATNVSVTNVTGLPSWATTTNAATARGTLALGATNDVAFGSVRMGEMVFDGYGVNSDFGGVINFEERYWSQNGNYIMFWDSDWVRFPQGAHFGDDDIYVGESGIRGFGGQLSFEERLVCDGFGTTNEWIAFSWDKEEGFSLGTHLAFHGTNAATNRVKSRDNLGLGVTNHVEFGALTISDNEIEQVIITGQGISGWGGAVFWSMEENTIFTPNGQGISFTGPVGFAGTNAALWSAQTRTNLGLGHLFSTNGRVGIGTNAPAETLHVAGNARIDGTLRIEPQGDLAMGVYTNQP